MRQRLARTPALAALDGQSGSAVPESIVGSRGQEVIDGGEGDIIETRVVQSDILGMTVRISEAFSTRSMLGTYFS